MGNLYLEYLSDINKKLIRNGIRLPVDLSVDNTHIFSQIRILEDYTYFNHILEVCDSGHKIESLVCDSEVSYVEWLKAQIKAEYESIWANEISQLVIQPNDAGVLNANVKPLSSTVSLIVKSEEQQIEDKISAISSFNDIIALSSHTTSFEDDEEDNKDVDEYEVSEEDFGDYNVEEPKYKSGYDFFDDEDEDEDGTSDDDFGDYDSDEEEDDSDEDKEASDDDFGDDYNSNSEDDAFESLDDDDDFGDDYNSNNSEGNIKETEGYYSEDDNDSDDDGKSYNSDNENDEYSDDEENSDDEEDFGDDYNSSDSNEDEDDSDEDDFGDDYGSDDEDDSDEDEDEDDFGDDYGSDDEDDSDEEDFGDDYSSDDEDDEYSDEEYSDDDEEDFGDDYSSDDEDDEYSDDDEDEYSYDNYGDDEDEYLSGDTSREEIPFKGTDSRHNVSTISSQMKMNQNRPKQKGSEEEFADSLVKGVNDLFSFGRKKLNNQIGFESKGNNKNG